MQEFAKAVAVQAGHCRSLDAPFTAMLVETLPDALAGACLLEDRVRTWPGDATVDAVPLRLAAGLHSLVRAGRLRALGGLFPPAALPPMAVLSAAVSEALHKETDALLPWLDTTPQTNEVGRAAAFMAAHLLLARETGLPASVLELGASAGLNMRFPRFSYRLGEVEAGVTGAPVRLEPIWTGADPPAADVRILGIRGVDISPVDIRNAAARDRLAAYVWPDHLHRQQRLNGAIAVALADGLAVEEGDAADWMDFVLPSTARSGEAIVVQHSVAFGYFPAAAQASIAQRLEALGETARPDAAVAWIALEHAEGTRAELYLTLRLWPGGEVRALGVMTGHGKSMFWNPTAVTSGARGR